MLCEAHGTDPGFSGARISLYRCKDGDITEVKASRQSIGHRELEREQRFVNQDIGIEGDSSFYLISDGYFHQGGGERAFSFGRKRLDRVLLKYYRKPMAEQGKILENVLAAYQGNEF